MISIYLSFEGDIENSEINHVVSSEKDYLAARDKIFKYLIESDEDLNIYIRSSIFTKWFWDIEKYHKDVIIIDDDPQKLLKDKLEISYIPSNLSSKVIIEHDLLSFSIEKFRADDIDGWILGNMFGDVWIEIDPSPNHLSDLLNWFSKKYDSQPGFDFPRSLWPILDKKFGLWITKSSNANLKKAYRLLGDVPKNILYSMLISSLMDGFSNIEINQWLDNTDWYIKGLADLYTYSNKIIRFEIVPKELDELLSEVLVPYWNTIIRKTFEHYS